MSSDAQDDDELLNALAAAFGDDALGLLDEDEDQELSDALSPADEPTSYPLGMLRNNECDTPLIRFVKEINQAIYSSDLTQPDCPGNRQSPNRNPRCLVFSIDNQQFGLPFDAILEIGRLPKITDLPQTPAWLRGVANLRGTILSVTDFRNLLHFTSERPAIGEKIVVIRSKDTSISTALVVDSVAGFRNLESTTDCDLDNEPENQPRIAAFCNEIAFIDEVETYLIDPDKLFGSKDLLEFSH